MLNFAKKFAKINTREKFSNEPYAKISTREMQFFSKKKLPRKLVPAKISTIKICQQFLSSRSRMLSLEL